MRFGKMKKKICNLKSGTPFKYKRQVFILDETTSAVNLISGKISYPYLSESNPFENGRDTLVTVCKQIRKSDIVERK